MAGLPESKLFDLLKKAIGDAGKIAGKSCRPASITLNDESQFRIYLWTLTPDTSAAGRPSDEYKIQLKLPGQEPGKRGRISPSAPGLPVVLGYSPGLDVFSAWEARMYPEFGYSSNVQIPGDTLQDAKERGWAIAPVREKKSGPEVRVAFLPSLLPLFLTATGEAAKAHLTGDGLTAHYHERFKASTAAMGTGSTDRAEVKLPSSLLIGEPERARLAKAFHLSDLPSSTETLFESICATLGVPDDVSEADRPVERLLQHLTPAGSDSFVDQTGALTQRGFNKLLSAGKRQSEVQRLLGLSRHSFRTTEALWRAIYEKVCTEQAWAGVTQAAEAVLLEIQDRDVSLDGERLASATGFPADDALEIVRAYLERRAEESPDDSNEDDDESEDLQELPTSVIRSDVGKRSIDLLVKAVAVGKIDLHPPWQRGDVWSPAKKRLLIESLLLKIPLPALIFHEESDGNTSVIDGKQRLTTITQFVGGQFSLPEYSPKALERNPGLAAYSGKSYDQLSDRDKLEFGWIEIPVLSFSALPRPTLYRIFELYNSAGVRLNAAEIRNAVYSTDPLHRMAVALAGEGAGGHSDCYLDSPQKQMAFTKELQLAVGNGEDPSRYSTLDFICRYFAYSRAPSRPPSNEFARESTAKVIRLFLDTIGPRENPRSLAREFYETYYLADDLYSAIDLDPLKDTRAGVARFHRLKATTSLILARILGDALARGLVSHAKALDALRSTASAVRLPEKQQTKSIWKYQADSVHHLRRELALEPASLGDRYPEFFEKMRAARRQP